MRIPTIGKSWLNAAKLFTVDGQKQHAEAKIAHYVINEPDKALDLWRLVHPERHDVSEVSSAVRDEFERNYITKDGTVTAVASNFVKTKLFLSSNDDAEAVVIPKRSPAPK